MSICTTFNAINDSILRKRCKVLVTLLFWFVDTSVTDKTYTVVENKQC